MRVAFLNPQGNFDPADRYWTEHPDFGGQLVYVKEVAQAMARQGIEVDLFTRQMRDPDWPEFAAPLDAYPGVENLEIIRIPFGGDTFLPKEKLWPVLDQYVEGIAAFYQQIGVQPDFITTHYADGGLAGVALAERLGVPFSFTGHSLGAQKMDKLHVTRENLPQIDEKYHFTSRIAAERLSMHCSAVNIVSTVQERTEQYSHDLYRGAVDVEDERRFAVIPPGVNTRVFYPAGADWSMEAGLQERLRRAKVRDLDACRLELPSVIASSRLDPKKNHLGLLQAFARSEELQKTANLCIVLRGLENPFQDYHQLAGTEGAVLGQLISFIRENQLKGKVFFLDLQNQNEIAECYREFSQQGGVFVLPALYEPFGLAPLEAAASGLPVVVTQNGGPSESFCSNEEEYGVLVDPENPEVLAQGLLRVLISRAEWQMIAQAGQQRVQNCYTWEQTAAGYLQVIGEVLRGERQNRLKKNGSQVWLTLAELQSLYFVGGEKE